MQTIACFRRMLRLAVWSCGVVVLSLVALAVEPSHQAAASDKTVAAAPGGQVQLTETMVESFLRMQTGLAGVAEELEAVDDKPHAALKDKLTKLAKNAGFASFADYDRVAQSIFLVMSGIDPDTGAWTDPKINLRADIEDVRKDTTLTDKERRDLVEDLELAIRNTPDVAFRMNIALVRKHATRIEKVLQ
ncbi:MAG: hypothetical protein AAFY64_02760 [Pseudomonadota bacterium]